MVVNLFHVIDGNDLFFGIFVVVLFICYIVCPPWWCFFSKGESQWFDLMGTEFSLAAKILR